MQTNQSDQHNKEQSLWLNILEALRGSHRDYTQGPIGSAILLLAIPMVLEMMMESVFAIVDVFFVGKLGPEAVATVGLTESMATIIYTVAIGLSIGATALVARRTGEHNPDGAAIAAVQALILGTIASVIFGALGVLLAPHLLSWMGASEKIIETGANYTRVLLGSNVVIVMLFLGNAIFRGAGDGAIAMRSLWLANGINIVLCPCFILGLGPFPQLGVTGAAVATMFGRGIGAAYVLNKLMRGDGRLHIQRKHLRLDPKIMLTITRLSASGTLQVFIGMASWIGLVRIISSFGSQALAGYTIGMRMIMFATLPSWGLSNAAATMAGQALGARDPERAEKAVWQTAFYNMCFLGIIGAVFVVFSRPIVSLFSIDPVVIGYASDCLRICSFGFLFYAYGMVLTQALNGVGDTWTPTIINFFIFWVWEIPLAYILAVTFDFGPHGVFWSVMVAFSTLAVVTALIFRKGKWKTKTV